MSETKQPSRYKGVDRRQMARSPVPGMAVGPGMTRDAYANLLKRAGKVGGRHAAITNSLYSWTSYKNWAEKMRGSWDNKE